MKKLLFTMFVALLMVGCGEEALNAQTSKNEPDLSIDLDDNETLEGIIAEAIDVKKASNRRQQGRRKNSPTPRIRKRPIRDGRRKCTMPMGR